MDNLYGSFPWGWENELLHEQQKRCREITAPGGCFLKHEMGRFLKKRLSLSLLTNRAFSNPDQ
jgi:hypothetical protein